MSLDWNGEESNLVTRQDRKFGAANQTPSGPGKGHPLLHTGGQLASKGRPESRSHDFANVQTPQGWLRPRVCTPRPPSLTHFRRGGLQPQSLVCFPTAERVRGWGPHYWEAGLQPQSFHFAGCFPPPSPAKSLTCKPGLFSVRRKEGLTNATCKGLSGEGE